MVCKINAMNQNCDNQISEINRREKYDLHFNINIFGNFFLELKTFSQGIHSFIPNVDTSIETSVNIGTRNINPVHSFWHARMFRPIFKVAFSTIK